MVKLLHFGKHLSIYTLISGTSSCASADPPGQKGSVLSYLPALLRNTEPFSRLFVRFHVCAILSEALSICNMEKSSGDTGSVGFTLESQPDPGLYHNNSSV